MQSNHQAKNIQAKGASPWTRTPKTIAPRPTQAQTSPNQPASHPPCATTKPDNTDQVHRRAGDSLQKANQPDTNASNPSKLTPLLFLLTFPLPSLLVGMLFTACELFDGDDPGRGVVVQTGKWIRKPPIPPRWHPSLRHWSGVLRCKPFARSKWKQWQPGRTYKNKQNKRRRPANHHRHQWSLHPDRLACGWIQFIGQ